MIASNPDAFKLLAMQAVLFGAVEHHGDIEIAMRAFEQSGITFETQRAVDQFNIMIELDIAEMILDGIIATIRDSELSAKDKLHSISKRDLESLYERWNEDRALDSDTPRLRDYIERRYQTMDRGSPHYLSAGRHTDRGLFPNFEGPKTDGYIAAANLFAAMAMSVSPVNLQDLAFKHGNTRPWKDRFSHGPAGLQTLGMEGPDDPCCATAESVPVEFRNYGPESLQRHAFLYSKGGIGEPPKNSGEVVVGDKFTPSSLQFMFAQGDYGRLDKPGTLPPEVSRVYASEDEPRDEKGRWTTGHWFTARADDPYVYHGTTTDRLPGIKQDGLQSFLRNYFATDPKIAMQYGYRSNLHHAGSPDQPKDKDGRSKRPGALLRVHKQHVDPEQYARHSHTREDFWSGPSDISPDKIDLRYHGKWKALTSVDLQKADINEGELAANGGLLEPQQVQAKKKKRLDDLEDNDGWSDRVLRAMKAESLYVNRPLLNTDDLRAWAKDAGFTSTLDPEDLHVTLCYSKTPVVGIQPDLAPITIGPGGREIRRFGKAVVLHFTSPELANRNFEFQIRGASSNFDSFRSHVTLTYDGAPEDTAHIVPYDGPLEFGPEVHAPIDNSWSDGLEEAVLKAENDLTLAQKLNQATMGTGKKLFDLAANLTTSRLVAFGFLSQAAKAGQVAYQVNAILDDRTCPVCVYMHGKTFAVNSEYGKVLQTLGTADPNGIKSLAPWPSQSKKGLLALYSLTMPELQSIGYGSPPYHPRCRCYLTNAGTLIEYIPTGTLAGQVQAIIEGLGPENTEVVDEAVHTSAQHLLGYPGLTDQEVAEADIADAQAGKKLLESIGIEEGEDEELELQHQHHKHKKPKNQVSVDQVSSNVTDESDLSELNAGDFTELASHGDLDAQNAYLGAVDTVPDGFDHDRIQAMIDNGQFHDAVTALNELGIDLNDFYLTPLGGSADLASHAHLTIEGTLDQNEIASSQLSPEHNAAVVAALANLVGKIDYANAFTAYLNNDWATLDQIFTANGINYGDYIQKFDADRTSATRTANGRLPITGHSMISTSSISMRSGPAKGCRLMVVGCISPKIRRWRRAIRAQATNCLRMQAYA